MKEIGKNGLTKKISDALTKEGWWNFKVHGHAMQIMGIPDIICCYKGKFLAIETKVDDNKPTKMQLYVLNKIIQSGGISLVITCDNKLGDVIVDNLKDKILIGHVIKEFFKSTLSLGVE